MNNITKPPYTLKDLDSTVVRLLNWSVGRFIRTSISLNPIDHHFITTKSFTFPYHPVTEKWTEARRVLDYDNYSSLGPIKGGWYHVSDIELWKGGHLTNHNLNKSDFERLIESNLTNHKLKKSGNIVFTKEEVAKLLKLKSAEYKKKALVEVRIQRYLPYNYCNLGL